jgi:dCTP deaminase
MSVKSDRWIEEMVLKYKMIEPFENSQVSSGVVSFGVSSYGYDLRVADEFHIFHGRPDMVLDPKKSLPETFKEFKGTVCTLPPNSFALGRSVEYFRIPRNIIALTSGKSTYARCGVLVNVTPLEPEWEGFITISIANLAPVPVKIYANEGLAQVVFLESDEPCRVSYADKKGKYQAQKVITTARIKD